MSNPPSKTLPAWLRAQLGRRALAALTGTDYAALLAAVQIADLYNYERSEAVANAFELVVRQMQQKCWYLAFHAIAHVGEWETRRKLWLHAGLEIPTNMPECSFAPGGPCKDLSKVG